MRLRNALALAALTAAVPAVPALSAAPAVSAPPVPAPVPAPAASAPAVTAGCGAANARDFPIEAIIRGGPVDYPPGGGFRTWDLELTNTTTAPCRDLYPVLVLADRDRALRPAQIRAEFHDVEARAWRRIAFEGTDQDESVGVFGEVPATPGEGRAFTGFTLPPGATLTVPVRLAFSAGAASEEVVVSAAVVRKRGDDGDWVGETGGYRLTIGSGDPDAGIAPDTEPVTARPDPAAQPAAPAATHPAEQDASPDPRTSAVPAVPKTAPTAPAAPKPPPTPETDPETDPDSALGPGAGNPDDPDGSADPDDPELARTGPESASRLAPVCAALLAAGAALLTLTRRRFESGSRDHSRHGTPGRDPGSDRPARHA
ncbi:hypothetical protein ABZ990_22895 [Streptomyces sp. NPDC046203]|uniref:hypothetical protein n=1 Tax=Streptomyces sp. NPDC046203 TaxID=3154602 RepID=UPI0033ED3393